MSAKDTDRARGWSIREHVDELGRTRYSISVGGHTVVHDALNTDAAVIAARRWSEERERVGRAPAGADGGRRAGEVGREGAHQK